MATIQRDSILVGDGDGRWHVETIERIDDMEFVRLSHLDSSLVKFCGANPEEILNMLREIRNTKVDNLLAEVKNASGCQRLACSTICRALFPLPRHTWTPSYLGWTICRP